MSEKPQTFAKKSLPRAVKISVKTCLDKKAEDIVLLDLSRMSSFTDIFLIMHGQSDRQNRAICRGIEEVLKEQAIRPISIVGTEKAEWILMDYGHFIVHIFSTRSREYYSLEKLWGDCPKLTY